MAYEPTGSENYRSAPCCGTCWHSLRWRANPYEDVFTCMIDKAGLPAWLPNNPRQAEPEECLRWRDYADPRDVKPWRICDRYRARGTPKGGGRDEDN